MSTKKGSSKDSEQVYWRIRGKTRNGPAVVSGGCLREEKMSRSHRPQYDPVTDQAMDTLHAFRTPLDTLLEADWVGFIWIIYTYVYIYIYNYINYIYIYIYIG